MDQQITFEERGNKTQFSCGCVTEARGENFIYVPCSPQCKIYLSVIEQPKSQENVISDQITDAKNK